MTRALPIISPPCTLEGRGSRGVEHTETDIHGGQGSQNLWKSIPKRRDLHAETELCSLQRWSLNVWQVLLPHLWKENYLRSGKVPVKTNWPKNSWNSYKVRNSLYSHKVEWKDLIKYSEGISSKLALGKRLLWTHSNKASSQKSKSEKKTSKWFQKNLTSWQNLYQHYLKEYNKIQYPRAESSQCVISSENLPAV